MNDAKRPAISVLFDGKDVVSAYMTKREVGSRVLEMYADLLCEKGSTANIKKFARTVTNKVYLSSYYITIPLLTLIVAATPLDGG